MAYWKDIWQIINGSDSSTYYDEGQVCVRHKHFKGLPMSKHNSVNARLENYQKEQTQRWSGKLYSLDDVKKQSSQLIPLIINNYKTSAPVTATVQDAIANLPTVMGIQGQDPALSNMVTPNIWISPQEAAAIYSQKGLPETIINKKGKSPLLNGMRIKNPKLSPKQHDIIRDDMVRNGLAHKIVEAILQSLIYGGALLFPVFKRDSPLTAHLPVEGLIRQGVLGKDCVAWMVALDRWQCVHIPNFNPVAQDFLYPKHYYIPFWGAHVSGERCSRVVTAPQIGYYAVLQSLGWGVSDIPGWIQAVYNYYNVMAAIPNMISQMSMIVRTLQVDSYLMQEGFDMMRNIDLENTARYREASVNNPINMDVIGDLKAIERDFKEVPSLVRLIRQDVGAKADIPEEVLFSSERGSFSSGDPTQSAMEKQWEIIKYMHRDVAHQLKNIAMIEVINALGTDAGILSALPHTSIEFDNPIVANAEEKSKIGTNIGKMLFDLTGSGIPIDAGIEIVQPYGSEEFSVRSDLIDDLKARQKEIDEREKEKHEKDMEKMEAEIDLLEEQKKHVGDAPSGGGFGGAKVSSGGGKGEGYSRMEQHQREKTRGTAARREGLQRAQGKKLR